MTTRERLKAKLKLSDLNTSFADLKKSYDDFISAHKLQGYLDMGEKVAPEFGAPSNFVSGAISFIDSGHEQSTAALLRSANDFLATLDSMEIDDIND